MHLIQPPKTLLFGVSWIYERVSGCDESEMSAESDVDGVCCAVAMQIVCIGLMDSLMALSRAVIRSTQRRPHYGRRCSDQLKETVGVVKSNNIKRIFGDVESCFALFKSHFAFSIFRRNLDTPALYSFPSTSTNHTSSRM